MQTNEAILVLGVGNILYADEGLGVRAVQFLAQNYAFAPHVQLMDGGTQGLQLMHCMMACDKLVVVDAVHCGDVAGTIYTLKDEALRKSLAFHDSLHQTDLVDTLLLCELGGHCPDTVIVGMEPADYTTQSLSLTPCVAARLPELCQDILSIIVQYGGSWKALSNDIKP